MRNAIAIAIATAAAALAGAGVARAGDVVVVGPGPGAHERAQEALIMAQPGQVIELAEGTFELALPLSLSVEGVTIRGKGHDKTILSFAKQETGSEGVLVTADRFTIEDLAIVDTPGDGLKVNGSKGVVIRRVRVEWTAGPKSENGGYGLYPVQCEDVLIEDCVARAASDAGIYVGQSKNVIIRRNRAEKNVAGIEVENSRQVDVYENVATKNTGGILVFDLPDLPVQGGGHVRVFENEVRDNDTANFAPKGNIVATVPRGTGVLIMANRGVEVFDNEIGGHPTTNVLIISYLATGREIKDPKYNPFPEAIDIHDNRFGECGTEPDGELGGIAAKLAALPLPDVVWDGAVNPKSLVDGALPKDKAIAVRDNGEEVTFVDLDLITVMTQPEAAKPSKDLAAHAVKLEPLAPVKIAGVE